MSREYQGVDWFVVNADGEITDVKAYFGDSVHAQYTTAIFEDSDRVDEAEIDQENWDAVGVATLSGQVAGHDGSKPVNIGPMVGTPYAVYADPDSFKWGTLTLEDLDEPIFTPEWPRTTAPGLDEPKPEPDVTPEEGDAEAAPGK